MLLEDCKNHQMEYGCHCSYKLTYCSSLIIVGHLIPCCHKDPLSNKTQLWKVLINILCGLLENTATGVLVVEDQTSCRDVNICPEGSYDVSASISWEHFSFIVRP